MEDCLWYELLTKLIMFRSVLHIHFPFFGQIKFIYSCSFIFNIQA